MRLNWHVREFEFCKFVIEYGSLGVVFHGFVTYCKPSRLYVVVFIFYWQKVKLLLVLLLSFFFSLYLICECPCLSVSWFVCVIVCLFFSYFDLGPFAAWNYWMLIFLFFFFFLYSTPPVGTHKCLALGKLKTWNWKLNWTEIGCYNIPGFMNVSDEGCSNRVAFKYEFVQWS